MPLGQGSSGVFDVRWLEERLDAYLDGRAKAEWRKDAGFFHPSDLSNPCDAAVAYSFLGYRRGSDVTPRVQRIFDLGSARDAAWKKYMKEAGVSLCRTNSDRRILIPEWRIRGECDDIIYDPDLAANVVMEIKTINQRGFDSLDAAPLPDHLIQLHCYMVGHRAEYGIVLYENKNDCETKFIQVRFDRAVWNAITSRIARIVQELQEGFPLEQGCRYGCQYTERCRNWNPASLTVDIGALLSTVTAPADTLAEAGE